MPIHQGPGKGPWATTSPEDLAKEGLNVQELKEAVGFINANVMNRQCFILIKNGRIAYEWYNPGALDPPGTKPYPNPSGSWDVARSKPHAGYSMTKTLGGYLLLLAATEDGLDLDADITFKYKVQSPKPYGVTLRMIMAQVIGGDRRPSETWRYDELGTGWLHTLPHILKKATGHDASYYLQRLHSKLGLSSNFQWETVDTQWYEGASGTCRDWARFGQLINNQGLWGGEQLIATKYIIQMQQPVKYAPYKEYSNPCYGLLIWVNTDKTQYPGCCWEASRLPSPDCGQDTFLNGGVSDLTLNIGLYGQLVMTLPSVSAVVVGFGNDLRPIEPARIGYYPGVCKALGIPCNKPPKVPATKCGEKIECTGLLAQCFSGHSKWAHTEPMPGKQECIRCMQEKLPIFGRKFRATHAMVKGSCPDFSNLDEASKFLNCYCGVTGINANPWHPWHGFVPPPQPPATECPHPYPTPAPPPLPPSARNCLLPDSCVAALTSIPSTNCPIIRNGGEACYKGLRTHWRTLSLPTYFGGNGCPDFFTEEAQAQAFCWCGVQPPKLASESLLPELTNGEEEKHGEPHEDALIGEYHQQNHDDVNMVAVPHTLDKVQGRMVEDAATEEEKREEEEQDRKSLSALLSERANKVGMNYGDGIVPVGASTTTGFLNYGDGAVLAFTSDYSRNQCGWYGCRVAYMDTLKRQMVFGHGGTDPVAFIVRPKAGASTTGCVKYGDRVVLAYTTDDGNTPNCGWYGCRVAYMDTLTRQMLFGHGGTDPFAFTVRPPAGASASGCVKYGDGVNLAYTTDDGNTPNCGWWGCRVAYMDILTNQMLFGHGTGASTFYVRLPQVHTPAYWHSTCWTNPPLDGVCHNKDDGKKLKGLGKTYVGNAATACAKTCLQNHPSPHSTCACSETNTCMRERTGVGLACAQCFAIWIRCLNYVCLSSCACGDHAACQDCSNKQEDVAGLGTCSSQFALCSGINPDMSLLGNSSLTDYFV